MNLSLRIVGFLFYRPPQFLISVPKFKNAFFFSVFEADRKQVESVIEDRWLSFLPSSTSARGGCVQYSDSIRYDGARDFFNILYEEYVGDGVFLSVNW